MGFDYHGRRWEQKRKRILRMDGYLDRVAIRYGRTLPGEIVHHIYPVRDYPQYAYEDWNLISVSRSTHHRLHRSEDDSLTDEGIALMRRTIPGKDWRKRNND